MTSSPGHFPGRASGQGTDGRGDDAPPTGPPAGPPAGEGDVHAEVVEQVADEVVADRAAEAEAVASGDVPSQAAPGVAPSDQPVADDTLDGAALQSAVEQLAAERLGDLQRLQAEYVNYRRRVERDRSVARDSAVASVLEGLLGVLDDVELARQHGDLEGGPFAAIAEKLEAALGRFGLSRYGAAGEPFDPSVHDALMHSHSDEVDVATVTQVLQPGYKVDDKVLRAARVAVSDPH